MLDPVTTPVCLVVEFREFNSVGDLQLSADCPNHRCNLKVLQGGLLGERPVTLSSSYSLAPTQLESNFDRRMIAEALFAKIVQIRHPQRV